MLLKLSDMLRLTLETKADVIPLSKELDIVNLFLDIQKVRFGERLIVTINVENDVNNCLVPTFLLQPIVENAIEHGIAPISDAGQLTINAYKMDHQLVLTITDDGVGYTNNGKREGIGLANTKERLKQLYGEKQDFSIQKQGTKGTIVTIKIPLT
jgi:two-component system, LytTR family, sensor kinase